MGSIDVTGGTDGIEAACDDIRRMARHVGAAASEIGRMAFQLHRYAIDPTKVTEELGWTPLESFSCALRKTVKWYLDNLPWCDRLRDGNYQGERLGVMQ